MPNALQPGVNTPDTVRQSLLNVPWIFHYQLSGQGTTVVLDDQLRLTQLGECDGRRTSCFGLGTAHIVESGTTGHVSWGRWADGKARFQRLMRELAQEIGPDSGMHYLVGAPTLTMPTQGQARYSLSGATSPTFLSGSHAPGRFEGQGLVQFGPGQGTQVAIEGQLKFGDGLHYRMVSQGAQFDSSNQLIGIGDTNIQMTNSNTFSGDLSVSSLGTQDVMKCGAGDCRATIDGAFFGDQASHLGFSYAVNNPSHASETDTIQGVAVMKRD